MNKKISLAEKKLAKDYLKGQGGIYINRSDIKKIVLEFRAIIKEQRLKILDK